MVLFSSIWGCGIWFFGRAMVKELNLIYEIDKKSCGGMMDIFLAMH
jgi:hypothetical protein